MRDQSKEGKEKSKKAKEDNRQSQVKEKTTSKKAKQQQDVVMFTGSQPSLSQNDP